MTKSVLLIITYLIGLSRELALPAQPDDYSLIFKPRESRISPTI